MTYFSSLTKSIKKTNRRNVQQRQPRDSHKFQPTKKTVQNHTTTNIKVNKKQKLLQISLHYQKQGNRNQFSIYQTHHKHQEAKDTTSNSLRCHWSTIPSTIHKAIPSIDLFLDRPRSDKIDK